MPHPSHSSRFYLPNHIGWDVRIIKLLIMSLSSGYRENLKEEDIKCVSILAKLIVLDKYSGRINGVLTRISG
jgi:uncharacterized protein with ParB-like and HNH nuclease domain